MVMLKFNPKIYFYFKDTFCTSSILECVCVFLKSHVLDLCYAVFPVCLQTVIWDQVWNFPLETDQPSKGFGPFIILVIRFLNWGYSICIHKYKSKRFLFTNWTCTQICVYRLAFLYIIDWVLQAASCKTEVVVVAHAYNPAIRSRGKVDQ